MKIIDIHSHALFGVDDGARNKRETLSMIKSMEEQGCSHIFLTPHSDCTKVDLIVDTFNNLKNDIKNIFLGEEIYVYYIKDIIYRLRTHDLITMNNTSYVLIEFSQIYTSSNHIYATVMSLLKEKYTPIIAHTERYGNMSIEEWIDIKSAGANLQINLFSLEDEENSNIKNMARQLVDRQLIDFVGSDSHRTNHRPPQLLTGIDYICRNCNIDYAEKILYKNAEKYLI